MMTQVAAVRVDPGGARVYAEGWQSWSQTGCFPVTTAPPPVTSPESLAIDCQYGQAAPAGVFEGSGLLAVDPAGSGAVTVFGALEASSRVPVIQARLHGEELVVYANAPVTTTKDSGPGGIPGALGRWADGFAAGLALREIPPVWCSW
jgi:alpha-galactosidase